MSQHWLLSTAQALGLAAVVSAGGTLAKNTIDNTRQDAEIASLKELPADLKEFQKQVNETNQSLAVLNERLRSTVRDKDHESRIR